MCDCSIGALTSQVMNITAPTPSGSFCLVMRITVCWPLSVQPVNSPPEMRTNGACRGRHTDQGRKLLSCVRDVVQTVAICACRGDRSQVCLAANMSRSFPAPQLRDMPRHPAQYMDVTRHIVLSCCITHAHCASLSGSNAER